MRLSFIQKVNMEILLLSSSPPRSNPARCWALGTSSSSVAPVSASGFTGAGLHCQVDGPKRHQVSDYRKFINYKFLELLHRL